MYSASTWEAFPHARGIIRLSSITVCMQFSIFVDRLSSEAGAAPCFKNMTPCSLPAINIIMPLAMLPVNDVPRRATCQSYKFSLMLVSSLLCTMHFAYSSRNRDSSVPKLKESRVLRTSIKYSWREKSDFVTSSPQRESRTHLRCSALR